MLYLSQLVDCPLHKRSPYGITNVSQTQFSAARHYGGCKAYGDTYVYFRETDELVRADVVKWVRNRIAEEKKKHPQSQHQEFFV